MKRHVHARGILVQRRRFKDTSLILTWITPESGVCKTVAKGALRTGKNATGAPDLYYLCDFSFTASDQSELGQLTEWQVLQPHLGLRRALLQIQTAQYFAELIQAIEQPDAPLPEIYALYEKALEWLETRQANARLVERFEKKLAELSGFGGDLIEALRHYHKPVPVVRRELFLSFQQSAVN